MIVMWLTDSREKSQHVISSCRRTEAIDLIEKLKVAQILPPWHEFSTGPSGPKGGDLGYFGRGQMVPDLKRLLLT